MILSALSPFDFDSVASYVSHWSIGFPNELGKLTEIPGIPGLGLIGAGILVGAAGLVMARHQLGAWFAANDRRIVFVGLLALATPVGEAVASLVGNNIFSTRNLAASWPFLALAVAALITVGNWRLRLAAATLTVAGFGIGAVTMVTTDYQRPHFSDVAEFVADGPRGVLVDGAALTPGPLTNFDVVGSMPGVEVFRLNTPEQKSEPFLPGLELTEPAELSMRAVEAADGEPITVVTANATVAGIELVNDFIDQLPPSYELTQSVEFPRSSRSRGARLREARGRARRPEPGPGAGSPLAGENDVVRAEAPSERSPLGEALEGGRGAEHRRWDEVRNEAELARAEDLALRPHRGRARSRPRGRAARCRRPGGRGPSGSSSRGCAGCDPRSRSARPPVSP